MWKFSWLNLFWQCYSQKSSIIDLFWLLGFELWAWWFFSPPCVEEFSLPYPVVSISCSAADGWNVQLSLFLALLENFETTEQYCITASFAAKRSTGKCLKRTRKQHSNDSQPASCSARASYGKILKEKLKCICRKYKSLNLLNML